MAEEPLGATGGTETKDPVQLAAKASTTPAPAETTQTAEPTKTATETGTPRHAATLLSTKHEDATPAAAVGAPENYSDFKYPDGMEGYKGEQLNAVHSLFKEGNLSQELAQKFVDFHNGELTKVANSHTEGWNATNQAWKDTLKADKTIGSGTDSILRPEVSSGISKLIDSHLGGDAFRVAMEQTGAGNHPDVIRGLWKIAQKMNEGTAVEGGPAREVQRRSIAQRMYPSLVPKET